MIQQCIRKIIVVFCSYPRNSLQTGSHYCYRYPVPFTGLLVGTAYDLGYEALFFKAD